VRYVGSIGDRTVILDVGENGRVRAVWVDGATHEVDWQPVGGSALLPGPEASAGHYSLLIGNHSYDVYVRAVASAASSLAAGGEQVFEVSVGGLVYEVRLEDERTRALAGLAGASHERGDMAIMAPMPGLVANVLAPVGQAVERGQTVVVLEAMKMENDLAAPRSGVVRAIHVVKGQTVNQGDVLAVVGDPMGATPLSAEEEEG
jgi:biotin carboxyl carrier protein